MGPIEIVCIFAAIIFLLYYFSTSNHNYWKIQGVPAPKPVPIFGNFKDVIFSRISNADLLKNYYEKYVNEPVFGLYLNNTPILILRDLDLIKDILIKDFNNFANRGSQIDEKIDPLSQNLAALEAEKWRPLRKKLTPVFSSGKLRQMFYLLEETASHLDKYLEKIVLTNRPIECRSLSSKFTMNVVGSCAFGVDINALSDEKNEIVQMGSKMFAYSFWIAVRNNIKELTPWLFNALGPIMKKTDVADFFTKFLSDTMQYREKHNIVRHDFVDLLKFLKENPDKLDEIELTDSLIAAQAVAFFAAGFETSSTTMSHALYELALNPEIQDKLRKEVREESEKSNGKFTYDTIKNMKYLHKVFQETLRKYPPGIRLRRKCLENYKLSGTNIIVPKNAFVWVPVYAIHRDPKYYPEPEVFDPERFEDEAFHSRHPMVFLPFGEGPRNCIGARFAMFQTKMGLSKITENYKVEVCDMTPIPYVNNPKSMFLSPTKGIFLKFSKVC